MRGVMNWVVLGAAVMAISVDGARVWGQEKATTRPSSPPRAEVRIEAPKMPLAPAADRFQARMVKVRANLPAITKAAEAVAARWVEKKQVLIHSPFGGDNSNFTMEMTSRAGGIDNIRSNTVRVKERSANDVMLFAPRSWEKGGKWVVDESVKRKGEGWLVVVFGSKAGMPEGYTADVVIDNFAPNGSEDEAAVNAMVNAANGWIFQAELTSALTRRGFYPGILKGMTLPGSTAHNHQFQKGKAELYPTETAIPAGKLGTQYLDELEKCLKDLYTPECQAQLDKAAGLAVERIKAGKTVWMSSFTHVLDGEVFFDNYAPTKAFRGISHQGGKTFTKNMQKGDLLFWFGEWTLNMPWTDYLAIIRSTGADYIPSVRLGKEPFEPMGTEKETAQYYDLKTPDALMVLEQKWPMEASVVDVPFEPRKIAPVTGVYVMLMYRMLDERIAGKL
jgi:uncharacterized phosphosugar-binding protein